MRVGDLFKHRESGVVVEIRSIVAEEVFFAKPNTRLVWTMPIWWFLESYAPVKGEEDEAR